jgi:tetratricopeptide (TPR) repeat protein
MGRNALCRGYFQEAVSCFEEALRSRESLSIVSSMHASVDSREWTGRNGSTISSDSNIILDVEVAKLYLAQSYGYVSRLEEAKVVMMSAVKAITAVLGNRNDLTALALCRLGEICRMRGNTSHARQLLSISFKVTQELFGDEHPQVATLMLESSENLRAPGYYEDCEDLCRNALDVRLLVFGSSNVFTALAVHHKAQLRFDAGKLADAEELYMHSMRLLITQLGEDSGYYAVVLSDFAEFCRATGNFDAAEKHFQRAMEGLKKTYGEKTISVHSTLCNYALLLLDCHQPMDAYNVLMKTVVPFFDKLLGHVHPRTLYARANAALAAQFSSFSQHQGTAEGSSVALLSLRVAVCFLE